MSALARFAEAETTLGAGRRAEGIDLIVEQLTADPVAPRGVYLNFCALLIRDQRYAQTEEWARIATSQFPGDYELWNMLGVSLRRQQKFDEALEAFDRCLKLEPKNTTALINAGNVHNDRRDGARGLAIWSKLVRQQPANAEFQRALGRSHWALGDLDKAEMRFNLATKLKPDFVDAWLDLTSVAAERDPTEALQLFDRAIAALPSEHRIREAKSSMLRRAGRTKEAETYLVSLLWEFGDVAWIHQQVAQTIMEGDRRRAHIHMEKAIELAPERPEYRLALAESLGRTRIDEAAHLERAYEVLTGVLGELEMNPSTLKIASEILTRMGDFDGADALSSFHDMGRAFADAGKHTALLAHLSRVKTPEDRLELIEQHRIWGRLAQKVADRKPIIHRGARPDNGKIRVGFMSSDLRSHPVAYFALPLFQHYDREKFEVYCYSYYVGAEDPTQKRITDYVDGFRWKQDIIDRDAAQMIADDQLDMLVELGGSTHMNKLGVMAYKPAPLQASWVGYPHSAGLETIDYLVLDPHMIPENPELVIEKPLVLPNAWYALGESAFRENPAVDPVAPVEKNGFITFGTANNPYKYGREMVQAWAKIVAGTPDSRFLFVRPEGGAPTFCKNMRAAFAAEGVSGDRILFQPVRGAHLPFYNQIDIALDTFPQTGGTTTCESLWMGVPVIARVGDAVFERLSYSVLMNIGLGDLVGRTTEEYVEIALRLAADPSRIGELRRGLRDRMKASPLGQTKQFADDYYAMIAKAVAEYRRQAS